MVNHDDGEEKNFKKRLKEYHKQQLELRDEGKPNDLDENYHELFHGFKITSWMWNRLYSYQRTGVKWLLRLHEEYVGGILADAMGLGKTIQVAVFLRIIAESQLYSRIFDFNGLGPVLIVAPATLMQQWVKELSIWFPRCRTAVLHSSGSYSGSRKSLLRMISVPRGNGSVLITSYTMYTMMHDDFKNINWHYVILDEGHKIRNPETKTTMSLKELRTPHRLLLSGTPLQNNLRELWSLIDFVYPGRLGSLKEFTDRFSTPITQGGFANATKLQVRVAYKCACLLRDAINPYMMQRTKKDVEMVLNLPDKSEQILFCDLTPHQRALYKEYITSKEIKSILVGKLDAFVGLINLRKLCNHPDLLTGGPNRDGNNSTEIEDGFGAPQRSGKLIVVESLLKLWHKQKQKVLLFSQSRQMLTILEKLVVMLDYEYLRMDGSTLISSRQGLVKRFNENPNIFIFLLTTQVGGLGLNLTGANRVVIYDPCWNPSVDNQAQERSWRIGQDRAVTIYRLMTSGTIEEKIYQRQIFKQFLANRILVDPKQKRFFKMNDLHELFTLTDERVDKEHGTETAAIFSDKSTEINKKNFFDELSKKKQKKEQRKKSKKEQKKHEDDDSDISDFEITLTDEYKEELREKASLYARLLAENDISITNLEQIEHAAENGSEPSVAQKPTLLDSIVPTIQLPPEDVDDGEIFSDEEQQEFKNDLIEEAVEKAAAESQDYIESDEEVVSQEQAVSKKSKKKKKGERHKKHLLDGKFEIKYLRKQKEYKIKDANEKSRDQDDYVLRHLLEKAGVHSALIHDKIINESKKERADIQLIEDESDAIARRAAEVLKRSHKQHLNFVQMACGSSNKKIFGQKKALNLFGDEAEASHKPSRCPSPLNDNDQLPEMFNGGMKKRRSKDSGIEGHELFGGKALSSKDLSSVIKRRRYEQFENVDAIKGTADDVDPEIRNFPSLIPKQKTFDISLGDKYEKLAEDIRKFFVSKAGRSTSTEVVTKFKSKVPPQDSFVFRSILRRLCLQLPNGHWALRDEYR